MKFTANQEALAAAGAWAASAAPAKPNVPILATVQIDVGDGMLRFTGTDYDTTARATCEAATDDRGVLNVPGRLFTEIVKVLPARHPVTAELDGSLLRITCGPGRFAVSVMPSADFPSMPELPGIVGTASGAEFAEAIGVAARATTRDDTLPVLTAVLAEFYDDHIMLVATDRYRLVTRRVPIVREGGGDLAPVLIPAAAASGFAKAAGGAGKISFAYDGATAVGFGDGTRQILTRSVAGEFPKWRNQMSGTADGAAYAAIVNAGMLAGAVKRCNVAGDNGTEAVQLTFTGDEVTVEATGHDGAYGTETVPGISFNGPDESVRMFKAEYLLDGLSGACSQLVRIDFQAAPLKPLLFTAVNDDAGPGDAPDPDPVYRYLVVPLRKAT